MILDGIIILFAISALLRGREIGFIRQAFSTVGFFGGLFIGALLQPETVKLAHSPSTRAFATLATTVGMALLLMTLGEALGIRVKHRVLLNRLNHFDNLFGSVLSVTTLLLGIWLGAAIVSSLPGINTQTAIQSSRIVTALDRNLPSAPTVIASLGRLVDPNGFPQVFIGSEPGPSKLLPLPDLGALGAAVSSDRSSVVKVEGQGCGGIVEGSGFVAGQGLVITNAHVIAGIKQPYVIDANGTHSATPVWFDPNLDFAVLRVPNLAGRPLVIANRFVPAGTASAVLGYPGGGSFSAKPAIVQNQFTASGRDIYGRGNTSRDIYEVQADIIPGNSGGPLIAADGSVIGLVFAQSTSYDHVGYALKNNQITSELRQAIAQNQVHRTGTCAE
ncbi:MAG: MarP family serine protease [Candidatus Saccharibacteria bacterium]